EALPAARTLRLAAAPNPTRAATASLRATLDAAASARLVCTDAQGRTVVSRMEALGAGEHTLALGAPGLSAGVYACRLTAGSDSAMTTITVLP
ncbi:MAG TPA: T9SS type A sorting domain-containing protein, partial [Rubricoccaceae bacterium]